ncbi:MAG TPA: hypothetical protein VEK38_00680, partial [Candidatus Bathyarchaeia archaeon]|nr:hypothetical protein [Candidatus Bathyarchaeia archaeon]
QPEMSSDFCDLWESLPVEIQAYIKKDDWMTKRKLSDQEMCRKYPFYTVLSYKDITPGKMSCSFTVEYRDAEGKGTKIYDVLCESGNLVAHGYDEQNNQHYAECPIKILGPVEINKIRGVFIQNKFVELPCSWLENVISPFNPKKTSIKKILSTIQIDVDETLACVHPHKPLFASYTSDGTICLYRIKNGMSTKETISEIMQPQSSDVIISGHTRKCQNNFASEYLSFGPQSLLILFQKSKGAFFGTLSLINYKTKKCEKRCMITDYVSHDDVVHAVTENLTDYVQNKNVDTKSNAYRRQKKILDLLKDDKKNKKKIKFSSTLSTVKHTRYHPNILLFSARVYYKDGYVQCFLPHVVVHGYYDIGKNTWHIIDQLPYGELWSWDVPDLYEQYFLAEKADAYPRVINGFAHDNESWNYGFLCLQANSLMQKWKKKVPNNVTLLFSRTVALLRAFSDKEKVASTLKLNWLSKQQFGRYIFKDLHEKVRQYMQKSTFLDVRQKNDFLDDKQLFPYIAWCKKKKAEKLVKMPYKDALVLKSCQSSDFCPVLDEKIQKKVPAYVYVQDVQELYKICRPNVAFVRSMKKLKASYTD